MYTTSEGSARIPESFGASYKSFKYPRMTLAYERAMKLQGNTQRNGWNRQTATFTGNARGMRAL